jgi:hypothetical protein
MLGARHTEAGDALPVRLPYFLLALHKLSVHGVYNRVVDVDDMSPLEVPDFPVRAVGNKATFRGFFQHPGVDEEQSDVINVQR